MSTTRKELAPGFRSVLDRLANDGGDDLFGKSLRKDLGDLPGLSGLVVNDMPSGLLRERDRFADLGVDIGVPAIDGYDPLDDYDESLDTPGLLDLLGGLVHQHITLEIELELTAKRRRLVHMGFVLAHGHLHPLLVLVDDIVVVSVEGELVVIGGSVVETSVVMSVQVMTVPASDSDAPSGFTFTLEI